MLTESGTAIKKNLFTEKFILNYFKYAAKYKNIYKKYTYKNIWTKLQYFNQAWAIFTTSKLLKNSHFSNTNISNYTLIEEI